jgi:prepilin-type N-terminal cleavage/methylation domain-containing protein
MLKTKYPIFKCMHRGEKGFTLIELLVVIAILGVIAAVVALNVGGFFGRGTVQAANTELHQVQTAVISAMGQCESGVLQLAANTTAWWAGGTGVVLAPCNMTDGSSDAGFYVYGPFRAAYKINQYGRILKGTLDNVECSPAVIGTPWVGIHWNNETNNWASGT